MKKDTKDKLAHYKKTLQSDPKKLEAFMADPAAEVMKNTGHKLTKEQGEVIKAKLSFAISLQSRMINVN